MRCQASEKDEVTVTRRDVFVGLSAAVVAVSNPRSQLIFLLIFQPSLSLIN